MELEGALATLLDDLCLGCGKFHLLETEGKLVILVFALVAIELVVFDDDPFLLPGGLPVVGPHDIGKAYREIMITGKHNNCDDGGQNYDIMNR